MLGIDATLTAVRHPVQAVHNFSPRTDMLSMHSLAAVSSQMVHLIQGVSYELMDEVAGETVEGFIKGKFDSLTQTRKLRQLERNHKDTVDVRLMNSGHAAEIDYLGSAKNIQLEFGRLAQLPSSRKRFS